MAFVPRPEAQTFDPNASPRVGRAATGFGISAPTLVPGNVAANPVVPEAMTNGGRFTDRAAVG
jgi:hypothetical protein